MHAGNDGTSFWREYAKTIAVLTIGIPLVAGVAYWKLHINTPAQDGNDPTLATSAMHTTPTSAKDLTLNEGNYTAGDCVDWNQDLSQSSEKRTKIVPCDKPHLMEFIRRVEVENPPLAYPNEDGWNEIFSRQCDPLVTSYLGYALSKNGRFFSAAVIPKEDGWLQGSRVISCGIFAKLTIPQRFEGESASFTGRVKGQDQSYLLPAGTCVSVTSGVVDCATAHDWEATGSLELKVSERPATDDAWNSATKGCTDVLRSYASPTRGIDLREGYTPIDESSWNAGQRNVQCSVSKTNGESMTGSIKG